jgi:hypothetical protein
VGRKPGCSLPLTYLAIVGALLADYTRARAEGLGLDVRPARFSLRISSS